MLLTAWKVVFSIIIFPIRLLTRWIVDFVAFPYMLTQSMNPGNTGDELQIGIPHLWIPARNACTKKTVLFLHGNATTAGNQEFISRILSSALDMNILVLTYYNYPPFQHGNGFSLTWRQWFLPHSDLVIEHCMLALSRLQEKENAAHFKPENMIILGHSVGSGVAARIAAEAKTPFLGLVLVSPYTSLMGVASMNLARFLAPFDSLRTIDVIHKIPNVLLVHGSWDQTIPPEHSLVLAERAGINPIILEETEHNSMFMEHTLDEIFIPEIRKLVKNHKNKNE